MADDGWQWVQHPMPICRSQGCSYAQLLQTAREAVKMNEDLVSDVALWCGVGGHAFSPHDPGRQRVTVEQWDEDSQRMAPVTVAACGDHARPVQISTRPKAALNGSGSVTDPGEAQRRGYDPDYVRWLEEQTHNQRQDPDAVPQDSAG